ncbi:MAG: bifunctional diaminohydroxyphosphoribosylaminopyrimidine deaminase/5-amino-6-(5-phosphoribosylamino)uracil reductase RibD [Candidatus Aminicenantes bacterium]|nr:bifunctional diaminohydroxyphosphoribosylaminopyrimidine deaminase/5-amino-6-(5-phosphoribosylamino)uracil reductase RibD [Candidatus Aminicenantes bacterium]
MEMAYGLAEKARGRTSPNPLVGAVIVKDGAVVGSGFHEEAGKPHAEIIALGRAGARSRGATLYLTLEPCVHWGRTPPCVDTVLAAGLDRVVISAVDPNPLVNGRGVRRLERAGPRVSVGLLAERNASLNEAYVKYIGRKVPFVTLKAALTQVEKITGWKVGTAYCDRGYQGNYCDRGYQGNPRTLGGTTVQVCKGRKKSMSREAWS